MVNVQLTGTGLVADDLYLMTHHESSDKSFLQPRALGLGLAGGLLAEQLLEANIGIEYGSVRVTGGTVPRDELARSLLELIAKESEPRPVRDWLEYLALSAADDVAHRLQRVGYLVKAASRKPWRSGRAVPANSDTAVMALVRACSAFNASRPLTASAATLACLATASGLGYRLEEYGHTTRRTLADVMTCLGPELYELISQTQAAVDSALLSHRM